MIHWLQFCQSIAQFSLALQDPFKVLESTSIHQNFVFLPSFYHFVEDENAQKISTGSSVSQLIILQSDIRGQYQEKVTAVTFSFKMADDKCRFRKF